MYKSHDIATALPRKEKEQVNIQENVLFSEGKSW
jgi:hypothetical protein